MPYIFDGRYDYTKPWTKAPIQPKWSYNGPWATNEERLTQQALMVMTVPGAQIQQMVKAPLPQIQLFPSRYGYGDRQQPGIDDVVSINREYTEPRISWYSGGVAGALGASRNSLESN